MKTFSLFIRESKDDHIYMIHGGSDFNKILPHMSGMGEPGNIRPLGPGLYGYHVPMNNDEEAHDAIQGAAHYSMKYGRGKKMLHVFKIPRSAIESANGPSSEPQLGKFAKGDKPQLRTERLPINRTEMSVLDPSIATRIGKFPVDTPSHEILNHIKNHKD